MSGAASEATRGAARQDAGQPAAGRGKATRAACVVRLVAGVMLIVSGYIHADLYLGGYSGIPVIGPAFLLQATAGVVVGLLLFFANSLLLRLLGAAVAVGALAGFLASRTVGVFGFIERGFDPAPQAGISVAVEITALVLLLVPVVAELRRRGVARTGD